MSAKLSIPIGSKFGRWTVKSAPIIKQSRTFFPCVCECGKERLVFGSNLINNSSQSCGCLASERSKLVCKTHGKEPMKLYIAWQSMLDRCYNINKPAYYRYGGRGIFVCKQWRHDYIAFREWSMANGYREGLSLDRINNNGNYEPTNCRWANNIQQANNKRNNTIVEAFGERKTIAEWSRDPRCNASMRAISQRISRQGWLPVDAIARPLKRIK